MKRIKKIGLFFLYFFKEIYDNVKPIIMTVMRLMTVALAILLFAFIVKETGAKIDIGKKLMVMSGK